LSSLDHGPKHVAYEFVIYRFRCRQFPMSRITVFPFNPVGRSMRYYLANAEPEKIHSGLFRKPVMSHVQ
jgi:hypothetical protein